jgi:serine phosphatase RsbU (regulator of sigma subunit)
MIRIASSHKDILTAVSSFPGVKTVHVPSADLCERLGEADLFLLNDREAAAIAETCESDSRPTLVVAVAEGEGVPASFNEGFVDDLVVLPLRALDVERLLHMHAQMTALRAVERTSRALPQLVTKLQEDIQLAQKIQRRLIKEKFPPMGGLNVKSKYWCGLKAGGDYFDVFEFPDGNHVGVILSDSSSYSLSTNFIGSLVQFSVHVGQDDLSDPSRIVKALHGKLRETMKEKDRFSIFYGILNRKTYQFRYVSCGPVFAGERTNEGKFEWVAKGEGSPLSAAAGGVPESREILLEPGDRLMLLSDGWAESIGAGSEELLPDFLKSDGDSQDLLNDMAFRLRKGVEKAYEIEPGEEEGFPMPPQDCSVLIFDIAKNVLRLAKG